MYFRIVFIFLIIYDFSFSQIKFFDKNDLHKLHKEIDKKQLSLLQYKFSVRTSPKFRATCKIAANRNTVYQLLQDPEAFDGVQISQLGQYNLRLRWKFNNLNRIYVGTETLTDGNNKNIFYLGFRKVF